jgi:hypothetical protein
VFKKKCKACRKEIEGARNLQKCQECIKYKPIEGGRKSRYRLNSKVLEDREFRSYFLGFLCTDGSSQETKSGALRQVGWYSTDLHIVEDITSRLEYDHPPYQIPVGVGHKLCWGNSLYADNARLVEFLGLTKDKEKLSLKLMDVDPYKFLLGHLDGDGTLSLRPTSRGNVVSVLGFLGRKTMIGDITEILHAEGFNDVVMRREGTINWKVELGSTRAEFLLEKMYRDSTIHLKRKRALWDESLASRRILNS